MDLTRDEEGMLRGDYGDAAKKLMEISLKIAELKGAERMVEIKSVHGSGLGTYREGSGSWGTIGIELLEALAETDLTFKVPYTTNVLGLDLCEWRNMGLPEDFANTQMRGITAFRRLGAVPSYTCLPYLEGNVPKMGDHLAWVETGTVTIANSYFGARSNRESDLSGLTAGLTGRTPEYGYHLKENRYGDVLIRVDAELDYSDLGALGYWAGKTGAIVPVFDTIPLNITIEEIQQLFGALGMIAPIALAHIVGITPEAAMMEEAFGGRKPQKTVTVGRNQLVEARGALNTAKGGGVDFVVLGCHFCTIEKVRSIARFLENKHVHEDVTLWVQTSRTIRNLAERDGDVQKIEEAGGRVYCDACTLATSIEKFYGFKIMATDSAKLAFGVQGTPWLGMDTLYGSTEKCLEAAITGRW
jgi:predicted aconitase